MRTSSRGCTAGSPRAELRSRAGARPAMPHTITLIPGDGIGPEVSRATQRVLEAAGVRDRVGGARRRRRRGREAAGRRCPTRCSSPSAATRSPSRAPSARPSARGSARSTSRCAGARSLRQRPPGEVAPRGGAALRGDRHRHRAREHRGPLRRPRADDPARHRPEREAHHREGLRPHLRVRLRVRRAHGPQARHLRAQGEHHEAHGRAPAGDLPRAPASGTRASSRRSASSTRARCRWCGTPTSSTSSSPRTSTATS